MVALGGAVGEEPRARGAVRGSAASCSARWYGVGAGPRSMPSMSCGMSSVSASSPIAWRRPGSAPGPPLWPGTWKRVEPRKPYGRRARRGRARSAGRLQRLGPGGQVLGALTGLRAGRVIARLLEQVGAHEVVEVAVEHALGVAHLDAGAEVLDHRVRVQDVGADLRAEVDVLRLAPLRGDLLRRLRSSSSSELGAQHRHRGRLVGRLRALVLALDDDAARPVGDAHGRVGLVDVLAAGAATRGRCRPGGPRRRSRRRRRPRRPATTSTPANDVWRRWAASKGDRRTSRCTPFSAPSTGRRRSRRSARNVADLMPGLLPRAGLEQLDLEAAPLGPAHQHAQDHLGPVLGVGAARAGVDGHEGVAGVVAARRTGAPPRARRAAPRRRRLLGRARRRARGPPRRARPAPRGPRRRPAGARNCSSLRLRARVLGRRPCAARSWSSQKPGAPIWPARARRRCRSSAAGSKVVREQRELLADRRQALRRRL